VREKGRKRDEGSKRKIAMKGCKKKENGGEIEEGRLRRLGANVWKK
jgi:hypothetical protein